MDAFPVHLVVIEETVELELDVVSERRETVTQILFVVGVEAVCDNVAV